MVFCIFDHVYSILIEPGVSNGILNHPERGGEGMTNDENQTTNVAGQGVERSIME
jgi:hypothetical protein